MSLVKKKIKVGLDQPRRLSANWTVEHAQDLEVVHGMDIEDEILKQMSKEISAEIDNEVLSELDRLAHKMSGFSNGPNFV